MTGDQAKIINHSITRFLARREHSYVELTNKLKLKGFDEKLCDKQLNLFREQNIQSDVRYAHSMIRNGYNNGKGPNHIKQKLKAHDIDEQVVDSYINDDEFDWFDAAQKVRIKKFGEDLPQDFAQKQKQMKFLLYRGFGQDHIKEAIIE